MVKIISLASLQAAGANTFADVKRDERIRQDRRAAIKRMARSYSFDGGADTAARVQLAQALEYCVEAAR